METTTISYMRMVPPKHRHKAMTIVTTSTGAPTKISYCCKVCYKTMEEPVQPTTKDTP